MIRAIRSYIACGKASSVFGKAVRLEKNGQKSRALSLSRSGLAILRKPYVDRAGAAEGSVLTSLTILVEQLASEANEPGADATDIKDTLEYLGGLNGTERAGASDVLAWIPYLEARLANSA